jgi:hypothetical protein
LQNLESNNNIIFPIIKKEEFIFNIDVRAKLLEMKEDLILVGTQENSVIVLKIEIMEDPLNKGLIRKLEF